MMTADSEIPAELSKLEKAYELLGELSRDETTTAYVARDRVSGNEVAIKVLRATDPRGREALAHYASDARLLTALEHPNIVTVHAVKWLSEDMVAVVTERVRGPTLRQVLDVAGTLPVARATEVLRGLGRALAWAHSSQIMHRDLRPENVIFEDRTGRVVLTDLGLARRVEAPGTSDAGGDAYRAPELSDGRYPDRRSDVYSLGVVGWELLTGRRPWPDTMEPIQPGRHAPAPPPLAEVRPGLPPALVAALEGAVQLDRDRRIPDVVTFMERLTQVAPPRPEEDEEFTDETLASFQPGEWLALPIPRLPQKPPAAALDREVTREPARDVTREAEPGRQEPTRAPPPFQSATPEVKAVTPEAAATELGASTEVAHGPTLEVKRPATPEEAPLAAQLDVQRPAEQDVAPTTAEADPTRSVSDRLGAPVATRASAIEPEAAPAVERRADALLEGHTPQATERAGERPAERSADRAPEGVTSRHVTDSEGATRHVADREVPRPRDVEVPSSGALPVAGSPPSQSIDGPTPPVPTPPVPSHESRRRRRNKWRGSQEVVSPVVASPVDARPTAPITQPPSGSLGPRTPSQEARKDEPPRAAEVPIDGGRVDAPTVVPGLAAAAALGGLEQASHPSEEPRTSSPKQQSKPVGPIPSDVELPPPEPVRFADLPPESASPVAGRSARSRSAALFEGMRGGLGSPRVSKPKSRLRSGSAEVPAPPALQPVWDTPAEFPLPAMPDPRPVPADVSLGGGSIARRRWTRRTIAVAGGALILIVLAVTLARMERAPDTSEALMQPEVPAGYGGDVVLTPKAPAARSEASGSKADTARAGGPTAGGTPSSAGAATGGAARDARATAAPRASVTPGNAGTRTDVDTTRVTRSVTPPAGAPRARSSRETPPSDAGASTPPRQPAAPRTSASQPVANQPTGRQPAARQPAANQPTARQPVESPPPAAPGATAAGAASSCSSPSAGDQRTCLLALVDRQDAGLNEVYGDVIGAMRERANSAPNDPDPPEVQRLRAAQRAWLGRRDADCRRRGRGSEGPLWATSRARCFAEYTANRTRELSATLARLRRD